MDRSRKFNPIPASLRRLRLSTGPPCPRTALSDGVGGNGRPLSAKLRMDEVDDAPNRQRSRRRSGIADKALAFALIERQIDVAATLAV